MTRRLLEQSEKEITGAEEAALTRLETVAEARLAEEERVSMRWTRHALDVVREAARLHGVPYQTYVKQVAYRQALMDLKDARAVLRPEQPPDI